MKKLNHPHFLLLITCLILAACASNTKKFSNSKNTQFMAVLTDPEVRKDFRSLKSAAMHATLYAENNKNYFSQKDIQKLNAISNTLINRLQYEYHLTAARYKIHTFIGKNAYHSCYQYYNSYEYYIGKTCLEFPHHFAFCQMCDDYIKAVHTRKFSIIHTHWWNNEKTIDLVDTFKLSNGAPVYMGLEISTG